MTANATMALGLTILLVTALVGTPGALLAANMVIGTCVCLLGIARATQQNGQVAR